MIKPRNRLGVNINATLLPNKRHTKTLRHACMSQWHSATPNFSKGLMIHRRISITYPCSHPSNPFETIVKVYEEITQQSSNTSNNEPTNGLVLMGHAIL